MRDREDWQLEEQIQVNSMRDMSLCVLVTCEKCPEPFLHTGRYRIRDHLHRGVQSVLQLSAEYDLRRLEFTGRTKGLAVSELSARVDLTPSTIAGVFRTIIRASDKVFCTRYTSVRHPYDNRRSSGQPTIIEFHPNLAVCKTYGILSKIRYIWKSESWFSTYCDTTITQKIAEQLFEGYRIKLYRFYNIFSVQYFENTSSIV